MTLDPNYINKYPYHCVEFKRAGRPSATNKMIDVVATKCFKIVKGSGKNDNRPKKVQVYFPPPPYSTESYKQYNQSLQDLSCPLDGWQLYSVIIKARAENLNEAMVKLRDLKEEQHAWSMSDANPEECENHAIESIRRAQLLAQSEVMMQAHETHVDPVQGVCNNYDVEMMSENNNMPQDHMIEAITNSQIVGSADNGVPIITQVLVNHNASLGKSSSKRQRVSNKSSKSSSSDIKKNEDLMADLLAEMKGLRVDVKDLNGNVDNLRRAITDTAGLVPKDFIGTVKELGEKFKYTIPLMTLDEFDRFDSELGNPKSNLKHHVMTVLQAGLDRKYIISKSAINMVKMFISKSVALQYVTQKPVEGKDKNRLMIKTNFYACMDSLIRNHRMSNNGMTTGLKDVSTAVGTVLTNAKSWSADDSPASATSESTKTQSCASPIPVVTVAQIHTETNNQAQPTVNRPILIEVPPKMNISKQPGTSRNDIDLIVFEEKDDEPSSKQMRIDVEGNCSDESESGILADGKSNSEDSDEEEYSDEMSEFLKLI
ncbi:hypothetical protein QAD02_009349 [Eretmocerus hayati]|uniref:Uncharacterized protein n=1 Tax=Eretmocerus hayati TaxID=131215 RepID=A0ACC2N9E7_9HYME|nr:hypothetical protein QAD02_009349 [Eretmocerus hayati]